LSDAKKFGDEFWWEGFDGSHSGHSGRGGIPLSRTADTEGAENPRYLYSRSLLRLNKSFHAGCLDTCSVESPCVPTNECHRVRNAVYLTQRRRGGHGESQIAVQP
jgi:hypothetical protein